MTLPLKRAILGYAALALIPAACAVAAAVSHVASGPGWVSPNYDVEYEYLLNALRFQQRLPILFFFQPATTLGFLYGAIIHISHAVAPVVSADVVQDVWRYPEVYIDRIHACLVALLFVTSFAMGVLVWRRTKSLSTGVALETGLLLLSGLAASSGMIWPETVTVVTGVLFAGALALFILDAGSGSRLPVALGVFGALGIAAKVTFGIVTLLPALLSRSLKRSVLYVVVLAGATGVLLAPIVARLPYLFSLLWGFASRTGDYGTGSTGFSMRGYLHGLEVLVLQNKIPAAVLVLSAGVCVALWPTAVRQSPRHSQLRALGALTLVELLAYAVIARQPYGRYLIPAALLMGVNLVIIQQIGLTAGPRWRRAVQTGLVLGLAAVSAVWLKNVVSDIAGLESDAADRLTIVEAAASEQRSGAVVVQGSWASSPARGLAVAEFWIGDAWQAVGEQVYPGQLFLTGDGYLRTWTEGLGTGWEWPNISPILSPAAEALEWRRIEDLVKDRRVVVQGEWDAVVPGLKRNPRIAFRAIRRSRLEALIELRAR